VIWRLAHGGSICVVEDTARAGSGLVTLALDDLDAHKARLRAAGLAFTEQADGPSPRRLVGQRPDGNTLRFFQNPA
jgi:hypothetical protein